MILTLNASSTESHYYNMKIMRHVTQCTHINHITSKTIKHKLHNKAQNKIVKSSKIKRNKFN